MQRRSHDTADGGCVQASGGGSAGGTGLAAEIAMLTGHPFVTVPNKFAAQGSIDAMVNASAALRR